MRGSRTIWLDITDAYVEAARDGDADHPVRDWRASGDASDDPWAWLDRGVAACLERLGGAVRTVHVLWRTSGATASVVQMATAGRGTGAAAVLSLVDSGVIDPSTQEVRTAVMGMSPSGQASVLVSTIEDDLRSRVQAAIARAGGSIGMMLAGDASAASAAITDAVSRSSTDPAATLVMGEQVSAIAVVADGEIRLCRFVDLGLAALREAYARALAEETIETDSVEKSADLMLMEAFGVPSLNGASAGDVNLAGVLRTMQPMLQRLGVELKQSIRFTLDEDERARVSLRVGGPGRRIKQLEHVLAEQIEADTDLEAPVTDAETWIALAQAAGAPGWKITDPSEALSASVPRAASALWAGLGVSLVGIGVAGVWANSAQHGVAAELDAVRTQIQSIQSTGTTAEDRRLGARAGDLRRALAASVGTSADFGASLRLLAEASENGVTLEGIAVRRDDAGSSVRVRADATAADADAAREKLRAFIEVLDASPIVESAVVGSVRVSDEPGSTTASYEITLALAERGAPWLETEESR